MKKTNVLLALAMVIAMFSFGFKAKAQTTVPVRLSSQSGSVSNWASQTTVWVTLHNNNTNEDFYLQTSSTNYDSSDGTFHLGRITEGIYTVTFSYYNYTYYSGGFDWVANDQSGYNLYMYNWNDYQVTTTATASADLGEFYMELYNY